ncbi:PREDICTED: solute carrier family 22 member 6-A-like, partial [Merops nubicus]|uniref:solute carrier family 22 member 6-A-like n=1 Tax=Merops nubicus TaxID=57421 RepID=UPI0004F014C9
FGRKAMLMWSYLQLGVMGTCTAFAPNYAAYCVFRFAGGMALSGFGLSIACLDGGRGGIFVVSGGTIPMGSGGTISMVSDGGRGGIFVVSGGTIPMGSGGTISMVSGGTIPTVSGGTISMVSSGAFSMVSVVEWIPTPYRAITVAITGFAYTLGQILLAGVAYAVPHWRWLQLTVSLPFFVFFLYSWAGKVRQRVAKINKKKEEGEKLTVEILRSNMKEELAGLKSSYSISDLVRTPVIRHIFFCLSVV